MLTKTQLLLLALMTTLGGSFAALIVIGIFSGDFTFAMINLGVIVALFCCAFVMGGGSSEKPAKNLEDDSLSRNIYLQTIAQREECDRLSKELYRQSNPTISGLDDNIFNNDKDWSYNLSSRRAGDLHVGGEVLPDFK